MNMNTSSKARKTGLSTELQGQRRIISKAKLYRRGGFLDLALALYLAAIAVTPLAIALALDIADTLPDCEYEASLY